MFLKKKKYLLIVCRANITRSAYLHGFMEKWLREQYSFSRINLCIESAGVQAKSGSKAHEVMDHVAKLNGFSLQPHRSRPLSAAAVRRAKAILVMEDWQKTHIQTHFKKAASKTFLLTEYLWDGDRANIEQVPDPTGRNTEDYRAFIDVAHAETERIFHEMSRKGLL
jgi:protein-tyrosine phosphatase